MTISFERPCGAAADVKELEYVSALHQTDLRKLRKDGSVTDEDIVLFLLSRYGIDVTKEDVRKNVIRGLGGGDEEQDDCIDLCEMVCMLLIPTLLKACCSQDLDSLGVVQPREGLLKYVLSMVLHDTTGSHEAKKLDKELIQRILVAYGEADLASNNALIDEMLAAAETEEGTLNLEAFSKGLTHDVQLYDIANEARVSTNYDDVFLTKNHREDWDEKDTADMDEEEAAQRRSIANERKMMSKALDTRFTAPAIDMVAGTFRSKVVMVLLWAGYMITTFAYQGFGGAQNEVYVCTEEDAQFEYGQSWTNELKPMTCAIGTSILRWLAVLWFSSMGGMLFIGCGSIGNKITCKRFWLPILGIAFITMFTVAPYIDEVVFRNNSYLATVSLVLGIATSIFHLFHCVAMLVPKSVYSNPKLQPLFTSGIVRAEANIKRAAAHKVSAMIDNALDLADSKDQDTVLETHFGQGLLAFERQGKVYAPAGGFMWTWKRIRDNSLFKDEGIWLSARLIASNVAQFIVTLFVLIAGIQLTMRIDENYNIEQARHVAGGYVELLFNNSVADAITASLVANVSLIMTDFLSVSGLDETCANITDLAEPSCEYVGAYVACNSTDDALCSLLDSSPNEDSFQDGLTTLGLLNASGFDANRLVNVTQSYLQAAAQASVDSLYPTQRYMVMVPAVVGTIVATITALSLAVTYIPSVTSTTLKLRSGVIPSLRDPSFARYRFAADMVTVLTGSMFWGCLIASILVGGLCGIIIFLFLWQATISLTQRVVAIIIGICIVVLIKLALVSFCRLSYYKAFYRKKPASANISALALECTNFSLSVGFVFLRMIKLIFTSALFVGRIDTPFLAPGVGRAGPLELDNYPHIFLKDVLSHEAHRHPYIELMGVMYLMKLRYGENFGRRAGSTWRLIFVCALFPWLNKYRIIEQDDPEEIDDVELVLHEETTDDAAFEDVLPFERSFSANAVIDSSTTPRKRPSDLMKKYQSVRTNLKTTDDDSPTTVPGKPPSRRRLSSRMSTRGSLLAQQFDGHQGEIQQRNAELEFKVVSLESNIEDLENEVDKLRRELGVRKTKRFQSANNTDDLHQMNAKARG